MCGSGRRSSSRRTPPRRYAGMFDGAREDARLSESSPRTANENPQEQPTRWGSGLVSFRRVSMCGLGLSPLITQRSLVQIQPPQPRKIKGLRNTPEALGAFNAAPARHAKTALPPTRPRRHTRRDPPSSALSTSCSLCFIRALARTSQCDPVGRLTVRRPGDLVLG
jgi:hypothetical protein